MVYVAWATVLSGIVFARRSKLALALAALLGGVVLFVSNLNWLGPADHPAGTGAEILLVDDPRVGHYRQLRFFRYLRGLRHRFADRHDR